MRLHIHGVHVPNRKNTAELAALRLPIPETVEIPMSMHIGAPANPVVNPGDYVKVGQLIGEQAGFIGAPVHSSVSGTVVAVEPHTHPNKGPGILSVVIKNDGKNVLHESVVPNKPLEELTADEIIEIVKEKGIVGMGGATFPTYVKLKPGKSIDAVLINGSECEPYLTADHRIMLEYADDIVFGLRAMMKAVSAPEGVILIEDNKPDAVALMEEKVAPYDNIRVVAAKTQYPEGAEKMLIKKVMGRQVPSGKLPADVGCVVSNTSTAKAISDAIQKGMPLVERAVSVTGDFIRNPGNYMVKLGTNTLIGGLISAWPADWSVDHDKERTWGYAVASMKQVCKTAEALGITLHLEILNRYESFLINDVAEGLKFIDEVGSPNLLLLIDTFHSNIEEDDLPEAMRRAGKKLGHMHLDENNRKLPGLGSLPWKEMGEVLRELDFQGYLCIEPFMLKNGPLSKAVHLWREFVPADISDEAYDQLLLDSLAFLKANFEA